MKKAVILLLFCLPILRGAVALNAQDSTRIIVNAQITDSSCHYKYRVVVQMMDGQPPYRFVLDSTLVSTTGIYENLSPGPHFLRVTDALGKISSRSIGLPYTHEFD